MNKNPNPIATRIAFGSHWFGVASWLPQCSHFEALGETACPQWEQVVAFA